MASRRRCGQAIAIGRALASVFALGVFWLVIQEFWDPLNTECDEQVVNATAQTTCDWLGIGFDWYLVLALAIIITGTVAIAAYQRQGRL